MMWGLWHLDQDRWCVDSPNARIEKPTRELAESEAVGTCWKLGQQVEARPIPAEGRKDDADKLRFDLLPSKAERLIVDVLTYGAKKYAPENWRKVENSRARYYRAARGHLWSWWTGEKNDPESGHPHLAHAACCILFLLEIDE